jgi:hypothetical protein
MQNDLPESQGIVRYPRSNQQDVAKAPLTKQETRRIN